MCHAYQGCFSLEDQQTWKHQTLQECQRFSTTWLLRLGSIVISCLSIFFPYLFPFQCNFFFFHCYILNGESNI